MTIIDTKSIRQLVTCAAILAFSLCLAACAHADEGPALAVTGVVFLDGNSDGVRDTGEKGLAGVAVSDGIDILLTDNDGRFAIAAVDRAKTKYVFVITPAGYRNVGKSYRDLPKDVSEFTSDFALAQSPETRKRDLTFAHITDIHVRDEARTLTADLNEIAAHKPAFIVSTGDFTQTGAISQYEFYKQAIGSIAIPVISVFGNHENVEGLDNYNLYFGPSYFSFDWGGCHIVVLNSVYQTQQQLDWLEKDLSMLSSGKNLLVFQHYQPYSNLMDILSKYHAKGIFTGHWHSNKTFYYDGIAYVNSPSLRFGGIDTSPRSFRLIHVADHKLSITDCYGGCYRYFTLVCPADGDVVYGGRLSVRANFYDIRQRAVRAEYSLDGSVWRRMLRSGSWGWLADVGSLDLGSHRIRVKLSLDSGDELTKEANFQVFTHKVVAPRVGRDWPMFKANADRTSVSSDAVKPPLCLSWSRNLGGTIHVSSPVTAHGLVYIGVADNECKGSSGVYALNAGNGKVEWAYKTGSSIKHTVAVYNDKVYAAEVSGTVYALDARTGDLKWQYSLGSGLDRWVYSSPVVKDGAVYVGVAPVFVALNADTGEKLWQAESLGADWLSSLASPAVGPSAVYAAFNRNKGPIALDLSNGRKKWHNESLAWSHSSPAYSDGVVYMGIDNMLCALDAESGNQKWASAMAMPLSSPAVSGSRVYVGSSDAKLYALDSANGKKVWSFQCGRSPLAFMPYSRDHSPVMSSPAISGDLVYFGSTDGRIYALGAESGKALWSYDLGAPVTASPAVTGNTVYIAAFDGTVYAFTELGDR